MWEGPWAAPALTETEIKLCVRMCVCGREWIIRVSKRRIVREAMFRESGGGDRAAGPGERLRKSPQNTCVSMH